MPIESKSQSATQPASDWEVRGHLAASLTFWHRLKDGEDDELVALFQRWATHAAPAGNVMEDAARYEWLFGARTEAQVASVHDTVSNPLPQDEVLSKLQCYYMSKSQVDALVDAARKQGGA